jgi:acetate kinase
MKILVLNAGSSSQKCCLYDLESNSRQITDIAPAPIWEAMVDWTHHQGFADITVKTHRGDRWAKQIESGDRAEVMTKTLATLWTGETAVIADPKAIDIIGHRVVHGGAKYRESIIIDADVKQAIAELAAFAPVHNPVNLEGIEISENIFPNTPQVAVFDTAFHAHLAPAVYTYAIPHKYAEQGIRRYGFHGISHQYCRDRAAQILQRDVKDLRLITCHLGNGCSLAAIRDGQSIDTTMGFTPLEGLVMGTRSGSIDAGILLYLLRQPDMDVNKLDRLLNRESGLLGISGLSADLRPLIAAIAEGNQQAKLAIDVFVHRLRSHIGAMVASLGGLDAIVFTAGIGENAAIIRALTCENFEFLGLHLDEELNNQRPSDRDIATADSQVRILVIHTQEDWEIARECWAAYQQLSNEP